MNLVTWNSPLRAMQDWDQDLDRIFENFLMDRTGYRGEVYPRLDVIENDDSFEVYADVPGVRKEDVDISLTNNMLTIKGTRHSKTEDKKEGVTREESGSFERSLTLPEGIDADNVEAKIENGVLGLRIPKTAAAASRKIPIEDKSKK